MTYPVNDNQVTGYTVQAEDWNQLAGNSNDANTRLSALESQNLNTRLSEAETDITSIESVNSTQNDRLSAVESKNTDQDTWMTTHLDGVSQADASHATINSRLSALESGGGGGGSGAPAYFKGWIPGASVSITRGRNMPFTGAGIPYVQQGGFTVSGSQVVLPSDGIYLVVCQAVANRGCARTRPLGLYATLNRESGAGTSLCAQELQSDGNTSFSVAQISATSPLAGTDYLSYRLFTGTTRTLRGMAYVDSQNRSVPYGGTFITITRLGGIA